MRERSVRAKNLHNYESLQSRVDFNLMTNFKEIIRSFPHSSDTEGGPITGEEVQQITGQPAWRILLLFL